MSIDGTPLNEVKFDGIELITGWEYENVTPNVRAFFKPIIHGDGYAGCDFYIADFVSASCGNANIWDDPEITVQPLVYGNITWDGTRHLYFGEAGYLYYTRPNTIILAMQLLMRLEKRFCPEHGINRDHTENDSASGVK